MHATDVKTQKIEPDPIIFKNVIYSCDGKAEFYSSLQCHMILQKSV